MKSKKLVSILLATVLLLTMLPLSALSVSAATEGDYTYVTTDGKATISGYSGSGGAITIPAVLGDYPVVSIRKAAFEYCTSLTSVIIPDSVTTIGTRAFFSCTNLTSVIIPDSVTRINDYAFSGCESLTSVYIPSSVTNIYECAFSDCSSLTSFTVSPDNSRYCSVDGVLFNKDKTYLIQCPSGKTGTFTIPDSVTFIDSWVFSGCKSLTSVIIPDSVNGISYGSFANCSKLTSMFIPNSVILVDGQAFFGCTGLKDVYYTGSKTDKAAISIGPNNSRLTDATWHYADDPISDEVVHSVMDTENGNGLAFRFELTAKGVVKDNKNVVNLTDATVNYLGTDCKLIGMGAVMTNSDAAADLTLDAVNDYDVLNIPTVYLQEVDEDSCAFAARIINIPENQLERTIYARPYYIVEVDGEEITVYGDVDSASCAEYL